MNKILSFIFGLLFLIITINAQEVLSPQEVLQEQKQDVKIEEQTVLFSYENEDLINIINQLAQLKDVNVLLPQGADEIKAKVTFLLDYSVSIEEAWALLISILDIAGYSIVPRKNSIQIIKNTKNINRETLPVYIGVSPEHLPQSEIRIRVVHYFSNIKMVQGSENEIQALFKTLMPDDATFQADPVTNSIIISGKSVDIQSFLEIALQLDQVQFQETIEIISLRNADANIAAQLINEKILRTNGTSPYRLDTKKTSKVPYFSQYVQVIPEVRTNALIILGRSQDVERLKEFIYEYIDVDLSSDHKNGESVVHVYQLQYLDAQEFAPVLENIISSSRAGGTGQSRAAEGKGGTERFFDEVIIKADRPLDAEGLKYYGGNKLIIAARKDDWEQIQKLIQELDTPQPQVLIEVLVADLSIDDTRLLGAQTRIPDKAPLMANVELQSAQLTPGVITDSVSNPTTIHSDLLRNAIDTDSGNRVDSGDASMASLAASGSTLLSLSDNDGQTWSILQVLKLFQHSKVLSHPHVIATNNKTALVVVGQTRRLEDEVSSSYSSPTVRLKEVSAELNLELTPRISGDKMVNLQVKVSINEFIENTNAQTTREVETNANVKSGSILALGGLIRVDKDTSVTKTPLFADVPFLGNLFKRSQNNTVKNTLTIFISPMIIMPKFRQGLNEHTKGHIDIARSYSKDGTLFDGLKDPITRWFFKSESETDTFLQKFVQHDDHFSNLYGKPKQNGQDNLEDIDDTPVELTPVQAPMAVCQLDTTEQDEQETCDVCMYDQPDQTQSDEEIGQETEKKIDLKELLKNEENPFLRLSDVI